MPAKDMRHAQRRLRIVVDKAYELPPANDDTDSNRSQVSYRQSRCLCHESCPCSHSGDSDKILKHSRVRIEVPYGETKILVIAVSYSDDLIEVGNESSE